MFFTYFFLYNQWYRLPQSYEGKENFYSKNDLYKSEVSALESAKLLYVYMHLKDWGYICWKRHWGIQESQAHNNASISSICTSLPFTVTKHLCIFPRQALFCFCQDHLRNTLKVICAVKKLKQKNKKSFDHKGGGKQTECFHFHCKGIFPMQFFKDQMLQNAFENCMEKASDWFFFFFFNHCGKRTLHNQNLLCGCLKTSWHQKMIFWPFENHLSTMYKI